MEGHPGCFTRDELPETIIIFLDLGFGEDTFSVYFRFSGRTLLLQDSNLWGEVYSGFRISGTLFSVGEPSQRSGAAVFKDDSTKFAQTSQ